jgi:hypothetical protein
MSQDVESAMVDLKSNLSFSRNRGSSGGGNTGGRSTGSTTGRVTNVNMRAGVTVANTIAQNTGNSINSNPRDPQGVWGRPTWGEGDVYSGNQTWGGPAGR